MHTFNPRQLVLVDKGAYKFIGRVVGRVATEDDNAPCYFVRRSPDDESTVEQMPASILSNTTGRKYLHTANIVAPYPAASLMFPVDMLRYDFAAPVNFDLVPNDGNGWQVDNVRPYCGNDLLVIASCSDVAFDRWTVARWRSFNWSVQPLSRKNLERR